MQKSANAVLALSRAFYGKRLTAADYDALVNCKTLGEFSSYLKSKTVYGEILSSGGAALSAKELEELVTKQQYENFASICRYELAIGNAFYQYFIIKNEIEQILRCTVSLLSGNNEIYLMQMNPFLDKHLRIDLFALGRAKALGDVLAALKKTPYEKVYRSCLSAKNVTYLTFELALQSFFESETKRLVKKCYSGKEKAALQELICRSLDVKLICSTDRALRYYRDTLDLKSVSLPSFVTMTLFSERQLRAFTTATDETAFLELLAASPYQDWFSRTCSDSLERQLETALYALCKKQIRFSVYPSVVMFCYLLLAQTETANLVRIIEGIKFQIPAQTLRANLIV